MKREPGEIGVVAAVAAFVLAAMLAVAPAAAQQVTGTLGQADATRPPGAFPHAGRLVLYEEPQSSKTGNSALPGCG